MEKVLIFIDDDSIINMIHSRLASRATEHPVETFLSGEEAIEYFKTQSGKFYIIFLDINMPGMDGWEFIDAFRALEKDFDFTIHILSSSIDRSDKEKAASIEEIDQYLAKPLELPKLQELAK